MANTDKKHTVTLFTDDEIAFGDIASKALKEFLPVAKDIYFSATYFLTTEQMKWLKDLMASEGVEYQKQEGISLEIKRKGKNWGYR